MPAPPPLNSTPPAIPQQVRGSYALIGRVSYGRCPWTAMAPRDGRAALSGPGFNAIVNGGGVRREASEPADFGRRAGRPAGRRAAAPVGLRRAAQAGIPAAGAGGARPDASGDGPGA